MERVVRLFENTDFCEKKRERERENKKYTYDETIYRMETDTMQTDRVYRATTPIIPSIHSPQRERGGGRSGEH